DGGHVALDADAVGAHDDGVAVAGLVLDVRAERLGVLGAELEDVADLDALPQVELGPALHAAVTLGDGAEIGPLADGDIAGDVDAPVVPVVLVGAGRSVVPTVEGVVGDDLGEVDTRYV